MLEIRPRCACCDLDLAPTSTERAPELTAAPRTIPVGRWTTVGREGVEHAVGGETRVA